MSLILEQYEYYVTHNRDLLESDFESFLKNDTVFNEYITALSESIEDQYAKETFKKVALRERETLLEAGEIVGGDGRAWAVMYFPILAEVYQTPTLQKVLTTFTTSQARVSLPRRIVKGDIVKLDGTSTTVVLPSSSAVRPNKVTATLNEGKNNVFAAFSIPSTASIQINRRFFLITELTVEENNGTNTNNVTIPVTIKPDFSGNFSGFGTFTTSDDKTATVYVSGRVDYKSGEVILNVSIDNGGSSSTITFVSAKAEFRVRVIGADLGKVVIKSDVEDNIQIVLDEDNEFVVELTDEKVQDFKDIYNIDILSTLMEVIKLQFQLNKDSDVADILRASESEMASMGNKVSLDFSAIPSNINPANIKDVYSFVVPKILKVAKNIQKLAHVSPQFLVTNRETAIVLETLRSYAASSMNANDAVKLGPVAEAIQFTNFTVIESDAVDANKIYVVYKANVKSAAALVDIVYKPLYVHKSDVNGVTKQYVKSRTAVELVDPRKVGVVELVNVF